MPSGGVNTITALKGATGIADNRLSAHHPNGPGVRTAVSDFWVSDIGRDDGAGPLVTSLHAGADGSPLTNDPGELQLGEHFYVLIEHLSADYWAEQIGLNTSALQLLTTSDVTAESRTLLSSSVIGIRMEITGTGTGIATFELADGMNTDAHNYGATLTWDSSADPGASIRSADDIVVENVSVTSYTSGGTITKSIDVSWWDPNDHVAELDLAINRGGRTCSYQTIDTTLSAANSQGIRSESYSADFDESTCGGTQQTLEVLLRDGSGTQEDAYQETITI